MHGFQNTLVMSWSYRRGLRGHWPKFSTDRELVQIHSSPRAFGLSSVLNTGTQPPKMYILARAEDDVGDKSCYLTLRLLHSNSMRTDDGLFTCFQSRWQSEGFWEKEADLWFQVTTRSWFLGETQFSGVILPMAGATSTSSPQLLSILLNLVK